MNISFRPSRDVSTLYDGLGAALMVGGGDVTERDDFTDGGDFIEWHSGVTDRCDVGSETLTSLMSSSSRKSYASNVNGSGLMAANRRTGR